MKLNYKQTFFIGFAFLSICSFWQLYENLVPLILSNTFNFDEFKTGFIMALDNILALFLLPFFGSFSDKIHTRLGKRTPFIIIGTGVAVIFMMLLPLADQTNNFLLFIIALGIVLVAMGSYRSPAVALMPDLTPKPLRSKANAIINLMGALGAIFSLAMISLLVKKEANPNYTNVFITVAILMILAVIVLVITIHENDLTKKYNASQTDFEKIQQTSTFTEGESILQKEVKRSLLFLLASTFLWFTAYNAITTAFSRYAVKVWDLQGGSFANALIVATGVAIISYIPIGIISSLIGRKKVILTGIIIITLSYLFGSLFITYSPLINIVFAFTGIGWASISVNSYPMIVEMSSNANTGKYTGLYYAFSMAAQIFTPILSGFLLKNISYRILFPYAVFFSVLSFCTMLCVKHGDTKPLKQSNILEHFNVED